ncbi:MAG: hypothetical protein H6509_13335 [Bryobacterales bacterium]|nr:hypothetical protein [Acidobacteriota bacterium]MCB9385593.1 hypothetical protein [Bryobacterales bacterium]
MSSFDLGEASSGASRAQRAMQDVWARTLDQIETQFGKLAYLAGLRNENSGRYHHYGLAHLYGEDEANHVLRASHERVFVDWLTFPLERQRQDIEEYLSSMDDDLPTVLQTWGTLAPYERVPPEAASDAERLLFVSDLEITLELMRRELASRGLRSSSPEE